MKHPALRLRWLSSYTENLREYGFFMSSYKEYNTDTESGSSEEGSGSDDDVASWISWFCSLKGNEFFCEVEEDFIQDDFNLAGLSGQVPYYDYALDLILDADSPNNESLSEEQHEVVETAAEMLYGLIHVRYILTSKGLQAMQEKYKRTDFGICPRVLCAGQACLPIGTTDIPRQSTVKIYCPLCEDCYSPRSKHHDSIDGAFFGTTMPHLLLMTYAQLKPKAIAEPYVPKVYGFRLHHTALNRPPPLDQVSRIDVLMQKKDAAMEEKEQSAMEISANGHVQ